MKLHIIKWTEIRGGVVKIKTPDPLSYIKLKDIPIEEGEVFFDERYNKAIVVSKIDKLRVDVNGAS